jgi:hypothetical protein
LDIVDKQTLLLKFFALCARKKTAPRRSESEFSHYFFTRDEEKTVPFTSSIDKGQRRMTNQRLNEEVGGAPLMVCLNDCALDHGQPSSELAPVCFKLGCAFAEMRWKSSVEKSEEMAMIIPQQIYEIYSNRMCQVI